MATVVTVTDPGVGRTMTLDSAQTVLFLDELRRATGFWSFSWLWRFLSARSARAPLIAPDLLMTVRDGASQSNWELLSSYVLRRRGSRYEHQFYFGLLLHEWLEQAGPSGPTP